MSPLTKSFSEGHFDLQRGRFMLITNSPKQACSRQASNVVVCDYRIRNIL
jgi:hypothetical protein